MRINGNEGNEIAIFTKYGSIIAAHVDTATPSVRGINGVIIELRMKFILHEDYETFLKSFLNFWR